MSSEPHRLSPIPDRHGQVIPLETASVEQVCESILVLEARQRNVKDTLARARAKLAELVGPAKRTEAGGYVVTAHARRVWDAAELEGVVGELVRTDAITNAQSPIEQPPPQVNGTRALALLDSLSGPARDAVAACFSWHAGSPRVALSTRVIEGSVQDDAPALRSPDDTHTQALQHHPAAPDGAHLRGARGPAGATEEAIEW